MTYYQKYYIINLGDNMKILGSDFDNTIFFLDDHEQTKNHLNMR